ncbi:MAG: class II aldolase/adducin family protein [Dehalococcoidia bacterium]
MSGSSTPPADLFDALLPQFQIAGVELRAAGLISSHGGNLSVWTPDGVVITRESAMLGRLTAADLCLIGRTTRHTGADPALDTPIHRAVYVISDGRALVHAHPPHAVALSLVEDELVPIDNEGRGVLRRVPVLPHARDIVRQTGEVLESHAAVLIRAHGCYARGADLLDALRVATQIEESARLLFLHRLLPVRPRD